MRKFVGSIAAASLVVLGGCGTGDPVAAFEKDVESIAGVTLEEFLEGEDPDEAFYLMCELAGSAQVNFFDLVRAEYRLTTERATELRESLQKNICDNEVWADSAPRQATPETAGQNAATPAPNASTTAASTPSVEAEMPAPPTQQEAKSGTLKYEVTSDSDAVTTVTYATFDDGSYGQEMATGAELPFVKELEVTRGGPFNPQMFTLVAQASLDASTITCKISLDGEVIAEQTSTGPASVVTCAGR